MGKKKNFLNWVEPGSVLITGGSAGLGADYARQLARKGFDIILVARREDKLKKVCQELREKYGVHSEYITADLAVEEDIERLKKEIEYIENLDILINNAGFGTRGLFLECDLEEHVTMNKLHMMAPLHLTYVVLKKMIERNRGAIINISSLASFARTKSASVYAATKAYLRIFTEVLDWEIDNENIRFQAMCPGFVYTEFHEVGDFQGFDRQEIPEAMWMESEKVVKKSLRALEKGKVIYTPGVLNKIIRYFTSLPTFGRLLLKIINRKTNGL